MGQGGQGYPRSTGPPPSPGMTGPIQQQPRSRIDPDQMPNPVRCEIYCTAKVFTT